MSASQRCSQFRERIGVPDTTTGFSYFFKLPWDLYNFKKFRNQEMDQKSVQGEIWRVLIIIET